MDASGPTLMIFWAWIGKVRVKVLIDTGASSSFASLETVKKLKLQPSVHEKPMRVQVADGTVYDANSCIRPKLTAETRKGSYAKQVTLRVMPLSLGVDVVLGGDWLRAQRRITFDYAQYGNVRFGHGSHKVVIAGCNESRQFTSAEQNYHAGERELAAIHHCTIMTWKHYLIFTDFRFVGDHAPLHSATLAGCSLKRAQSEASEMVR
eukprot:gene34117-biopygen13990